MKKEKRLVVNFLILLILLIYTHNYPLEQRKDKILEKNNINSLTQSIKTGKDNNKRHLTGSDCGELSQLKIYLDLYNFNKTYPNETILEYKDKLLESMKEAQNLLEKIICIDAEIEISKSSFESQNRDEWGLEYWDASIFEIFVNMSQYNYYILFKFDNSIHEIASAYIYVSFSVPAIGVITINPDKIIQKQPTSKYLTNLMLQHFIHLLGFQIDTDEYTNLNIKEEEDEEEEGKYYYNIYKEDSQNLFDYAQKYFGCDKIDKITFEIDEDKNIYWPSRLFLGEVMTNFDYPEEKTISMFTLLFLEDLGIIQVNKKYTGGLMKFGKKKGCKFFFGDCGRNLNEDPADEGSSGDVNEEYTTNIDKSLTFSNEFYLPTEYTSNPEPSCSSGRLSKTIYQLYELNLDDANTKFEYSIEERYFGRKETNYCPIAEFKKETSGNLHTGSCYDNETEVDSALNEETGNNSFCVLRSLNSGNNIDNIRAACYKMFCSSQSLTIKIGNNYIVCPRSGGKIQPEGFNYYILCPDYYLICSGEPLCNNIFDCIDKSSEEKPDFLSNSYYIKTTQNSSQYITDPIITVNTWELSEDGKCPKLCMKCDLEGNCITCAPHHKIYNPEDRECLPKVPNCDSYDDNDVCKGCISGYSLLIGDNTTIVCIDDTIIDNQYYSEIKDGITYYSKCYNGISKCDICDSKTECTHCFDGYLPVDNGEKCLSINSKLYYLDTNDGNKHKSCYKYEQNQNCEECEIVEGNYKCLKCKENYAFFFDEIDTNKCIDKSTKVLNKYFTTDSLNFYPCNNLNYHNINNCDVCDKNNECESCIGEYISVNDKKLCILLSEKIYYQDSDNYYYPCSNSLDHCHKCESKTKCIECDNTDYYLEEETGRCIYKDLVENNYYCLDNNKAINCSKMQNCEKCISSINCLWCINGFNFVENNNEITCQNINPNHYYSKTENGKTIYVKCDKDIAKCLSCSSSNHCTECQNGFAIIDGNDTVCKDLSTEKYYKRKFNWNI